MMRSPPGGFLGGGNMLRSLTLSPMNAMLQQAHQMARRHLESGGTAALVPTRAKADIPAKQPNLDLAPRDFVLPLDVDAEEVRQTIEAMLDGASLRSTAASPILERKAGGRVAVSSYHVLRLGEGRFDLGRRFLHGLVRRIRAGRVRRRQRSPNAR